MNRPRIGGAGALALLVGLTLTTAVPGAVGPTRADAAGLHRAGVVVDPGDGSGPHTACVWFEEESISGLELLARSSFDAGVRAFGGLGGAVCSIDGAGCSTDSACLSCGGTQYWAYATANPGDTTFAQAPAGAGSRTVMDGAVDGWRWGSGDPPGFRSIDRICPASPAAKPTAPPLPAPVPPAPAAAAPAGPQAPVLPNDLPPQQPASPVASATTAVPPTSTTSSVVPSSTVVSSTTESTTSLTSSSSSTSTTIDSDADPAATVASAAIVTEGEDGADGGGPGVLGVVAVVLAAGVGAAAVWRIRRSP